MASEEVDVENEVEDQAVLEAHSDRVQAAPSSGKHGHQRSFVVAGERLQMGGVSAQSGQELVLQRGKR